MDGGEVLGRGLRVKGRKEANNGLGMLLVKWVGVHRRGQASLFLTYSPQCASFCPLQGDFSQPVSQCPSFHPQGRAKTEQHKRTVNLPFPLLLCLLLLILPPHSAPLQGDGASCQD